MGRMSAEFKQIYWLSRFLTSMPDPPAKELKDSELTNEQRIARYAHRAFYLMTGEKFNKKEFNDMMNPYKTNKV